MKRWEENGWQKEDLNKLSLSFLNNIFELKTPRGVSVSVEFAKYLNETGLNPDNYPIFLMILGMENHWVVDALVGENDIETMFNHIQPNYFILKECFQALTRSPKGGIYEKSLAIILSIIKRTYKNSLEGYRVYDLTNENLNNLGKHLDEELDQRNALNMTILTILDNISALVDPAHKDVDPKINALSVHANNIRGKYLDMSKQLREAIPDELLIKGDFANSELAPTEN